MVMERGEVRWYTFAAPDKRRPVVLLTREPMIRRLNDPRQFLHDMISRRQRVKVYTITPGPGSGFAGLSEL
jgi:hypothetical protein